MTIFRITEKKDLHSFGNSKVIDCLSLRNAMNYATLKQKLLDTVITIEDNFGNLLTYKKSGIWVHIDSKMESQNEEQ